MSKAMHAAAVLVLAVVVGATAAAAQRGVFVSVEANET